MNAAEVIQLLEIPTTTTDDAFRVRRKIESEAPLAELTTAFEMDILLAILAGDALAWLIGTLAIYAINHPISLSGGTPTTSTTTTSGQPQSGPTINEVRAHQNDLPLPGKATGPYIYYPPKGAKGDPAKAWNKEKGGFRDDKDNVWVWDKLHDDHWDVQHKDGTYTNVRPDGTKGQGTPHHRR